MLTLKGRLRGKMFVNDDGVCYPLMYVFNNEPDEVYVNCTFENDGILSIYKIFRIK